MRRPPTKTLTRAPTASRLHLTPRHSTSSQFFLVPKFLSKLGRSPRLLITTSSAPSLSRSPAADPREDHGLLIPSPAESERSLNFPPPTFQYNSLGCLYLAVSCIRSTSGYTWPLTIRMSFRPSWSTSSMCAPQPRYWLCTPRPAEYTSSVNVPSWALW